MGSTTMKAAYIRREWVERAEQLLPNTSERLLFYEAILHYSLNEKRDTLQGAPAIMFEMIKTAIDDDRSRYEAKCERNRNNARRKPVAASGSQWQPLEATPTTTTTTTPTTTTTTTTTISIEEEEKDRFLIIGIFLSRGAMDPVKEADTFWNYYESLGWKNNKGAAIVSKTSAATMWRMQGETIADITQVQLWYKCFKSSPIYLNSIWTAFERYNISEECTLHVFLKGTESEIAALVQTIETRCVAQLKLLLTATKAKSLEYHCRQS